MKKCFVNLKKQAGSVLFAAALVSSVSFVGTAGTVSIQAAEQEPVIAEEYTLDKVNFRLGPSTDSKVLEVLDFGTPVLVEALNPGGWSLVSCHNQDGYVLSEYLGDKTAFEEAAEQPANRTVELIPWSEAQDIFEIGKDAEVYDCYTGAVYYVRSFSNGSHADVEPITVQDTEILKQTLAVERKPKLYLGGTTQVLNQPEFKDIAKVKGFLKMLEEESHLYDMLHIDNLSGDSGVVVTIGQENKFTGIHDCSMVKATYCLEGKIVGAVAVLGPTRMEYGKVMTVLEFIQRHLGEVLSKNKL